MGTRAGLSAAALHGSRWIDPGLPAELNQPSRHGREPGIVLHSDRLADDERCLVASMPITTPARTAFDLGRSRGFEDAVIRIDALIQATGLTVDEIAAVAARYPGARGMKTLRKALAAVDGGAESPQETRTRLLLTRDGPAPERTRIEVFDPCGRFVARIDMGWERRRVGVEYDGRQHWIDPAVRRRDIDRQAELEALGWRIVRVGDDLLRHRPGVVVARTRAALSAAGA